MIVANAFATAWPVSFERLLSILIKLRDQFARTMAKAKQDAQRLAAQQSTPVSPTNLAETAVSAQSASRDCANFCGHGHRPKVGREAVVDKNGTVPLNALEWGQKYLPDHFAKPPSAMHHWLAEQIDRAHYMRGTRLNVLGPRDGAKSTIGALALPLRAALKQHEPYESNQFQDLLAGQFETEFRRQGILAARPVPIENHTPKQVRIRRLGSYLASRRFRFKANSPTTRLLVEQLQEFPLADHDDGPDALEMAIRLAGQVLHGRTFNDGLGNRLRVG